MSKTKKLVAQKPNKKTGSLKKKLKKKVLSRKPQKLLYIRARLQGHCRCGGTVEVAAPLEEESKVGYYECVSCKDYYSATSEEVLALIKRYL